MLEFKQLKDEQRDVDFEGLILDLKAVYKSKKGIDYPKTLVNFEDVESLAVREKWLYQTYVAKVR